MSTKPILRGSAVLYVERNQSIRQAYNNRGETFPSWRVNNILKIVLKELRKTYHEDGFVNWMLQLEILRPIEP